jgi:hypothetical protein
MLPKKACQQIHANRRAKQRLGIDFNRHKAREVINGIHSNRFIFEAKAGKARSWYKGLIDGVMAWVLWDKETDRIVTVLDYEPKEIKPYKDKCAINVAKAQGKANAKMDAAQKQRDARALMLASMTPNDRKEYKRRERVAFRESLGFHIYTKEERMK